ncbi:GIDE domain-containing protein [Haloarchaeobius sp. HRN-SO-5]|uniref:GIDE domain-containing protein n=1 Tax=Haloarchaeobius sp. HRN-SO-5 TaxID=3446118 RepID=UPI003EB74EAB
MNPFVSLFLLAGVALLGYGAVVVTKIRRISQDDPKSAYRVRDGGRFEVEGTARPHDEVVRSPFTDTPCLACQWTVEEYKQSGKHSHWATVDRGTWTVPFVLEDDTGRVLVDPEGATLSLGESRTVEVDGGDAPPTSVQEFIDANARVDDEDTELDLKLFSVATGNDRRYVEKRLDDGEHVYVYGHARPNRQPRSDVDGTVGAPVREDAGPLGSVVDRLWGPLFLVSDTTERGVVGRLRRKAAVPLLLGLACLAVVATLGF